MTVTLTEGFQIRRDLRVEGGKALIEDALNDLLYVNVHSEAFPSGEIRGQLGEGSFRVFGNDVGLEGVLSGDQEVPSVLTDATGEAKITIETSFFSADATFVLEIRVIGIGTDDARAMHIHSGAEGTNGGVVVNLDPSGALQLDTLAALTAAGFEQINIWTATRADEFLQGSQALDTILGKAGHDTLKGANGNDLLDGGAGRDVVNGGNGDDSILGGNGNDRLFAGAGRDIVVPGNGADRIKTGPGFDQIIFDLENLEKAGVDRVLDFSAGDALLFMVEERFTRKFGKINATAEDLQPAPKANTIVLWGAELTTEEAQARSARGPSREGVIVFDNADSGEIELIYSADLSNAEAETQVLARLGTDTDQLWRLQAGNFSVITPEILDDIL